MNFQRLWAIARAEMRLARRLFRFWVFVVLAVLVTVLNYGQLLAIHWNFSGFSASAASAFPRFFIGSFGSQFLLVFLFGLVFLGFDVRARDKRERMVEVLDALPCTNLELVLGRAVGIVIPSWIAVALTSLVLYVVGRLLGAAPEPFSLTAFVVLMTLPAYLFTVGLVFFLTLLLRHRLIAALASIGVLIAAFIAGLWWVPISQIAWIDVTGGYSLPFPSDIVPALIDLPGLLQRIGFALIGVALLWFAATIHPRRDDGSRARRAGVGVLLLLLGVAGTAYSVLQFKGILDRKEAWREVHGGRSADPAPDVLALSGNVRVSPGSDLTLALALEFGAREGQPLDAALFSLNPGLAVAAVRDAGGGELSYTFENGLLEIALPATLEPGARSRVEIDAAGTLDGAFAYLDAALEPLTLDPVHAQIFVLGYEPYVSDRRYVALMPGTRWLPASGAEIGRGDPAARPVDFFDLDLTVELPGEWKVAGPGRARPVEGQAAEGYARYRFTPGAPVPEAALVAGEFVSRSAEIEGVHLELLVHPKHAANVEIFDDAAGELRERLTEQLSEAAEEGLGYPYDALTMVEVPNVLRGYAGGWRMDSTLIQPALVLMRESGFPTARFSWIFRNPQRFQEREGGLPRYKREALERFFENDMNGGNVFVAAARSFFGYQTAARGSAGVPLDYVFEDLTTRLVTEKRGYFSVHMFDQQFGQRFMQAGMAMQNPDRIGETYADVLIHMLTSKPEIWEAILQVSLVDLDPWEHPARTVDVLGLKGSAMSQSMLDGLGREKAAELLAAVRRTGQGGSFTRSDVEAQAAEIDRSLDDWLDVWLDQTALPGFTVSDVVVERISDADDGTPRYQSTIVVRNEENVPGLLRIDYRIGDGNQAADRGSSDPARVDGRSAVEIGVVTAEPPRTLRVSPYLALNRDPFNVPLPAFDAEKIVDAEGFIGVREAPWKPVESPYIVVDDLDEGFDVEESGRRGLMRVAGRGTEEESLDQGLPVADSFRQSSRWSRMTMTEAYGKYRHTAAVVRAGSGERAAIFTAELPRSGPWALELFVPQSPARRSRKRGTWNLEVVDTSGRHELSFDADGAEPGWNTLQTIEIAGGEVQVRLLDRTDGSYVIADAIRWAPAELDTREVASR